MNTDPWMEEFTSAIDRIWEHPSGGDQDRVEKAPELSPGSTEEDYRSELELARWIAQTDFSSESRIRQTLKERLLAQAPRPALFQSLFQNPVRRLIWSAAILLLVISLTWLFSNGYPQPAITPTFTITFTDTVPAQISLVQVTPEPFSPNPTKLDPARLEGGRFQSIPVVNRTVEGYNPEGTPSTPPVVAAPFD